MKKIALFLAFLMLFTTGVDAQRKRQSSHRARTSKTRTARTQQPSIYGYAAKWKEKAESGDAEAQCQLGDCFDGGIGTSKNYTEALKWYRKAAEQEYPYGVWNLGRMYEFGRGVTKNTTTAESLYKQAHILALPLANNGNASAQIVMGKLCEFGLGGVAQNKEEAVKWCRKAAEQGLPAAQNNLGYCYDEGVGVALNDEEAVKWYQKAAEQGDPDAQNALGLCYQYGEGVARNKSMAIKWYKKAIEQGDSDAQDNLNELLGENKSNSRTTTSQRNVSTNYDKFYGTWRSGGTTFTITPGPYLNLHGAGRFSGEWRSNGELHVSFGYPDEINLRYSNGYLYNRDGRRYWRVN